jgi:hypothetical protein
MRHYWVDSTSGQLSRRTAHPYGLSENTQGLYVLVKNPRRKERKQNSIVRSRDWIWPKFNKIMTFAKIMILRLSHIIIAYPFTTPDLDITVKSKPPSLPDFEPAQPNRQWWGIDITADSYEPTLMLNRQWCGFQEISHKIQRKIEIKFYYQDRTHQTTTQFFYFSCDLSRKTRASRPSALEPLTSCSAYSSLNHSTCTHVRI